MSTGERIRFFRNLRRMTQKTLGVLVGFPEKTADIRIAQYESGARTPKTDLTNRLAEVLDVSPLALTVPTVNNKGELLHLLFALEDTHGFRISIEDGEPCISLKKLHPEYEELLRLLTSWAVMAEEVRRDNISQETYDKWRYNFALCSDADVLPIDGEFFI